MAKSSGCSGCLQTCLVIYLATIVFGVLCCGLSGQVSISDNTSSSTAKASTATAEATMSVEVTCNSTKDDGWPEETTEWGHKIRAKVTGTQPSHYSWQYSWDGGQTWEEYCSEDSGKFDNYSPKTQSDWIGSLWRCQVTAADKDGNVTDSATSNVFGPVTAASKTIFPVLTGCWAAGYEMGLYLEIPDETTVSYQWKRSPEADGAYEDIPGATDDKYTPSTDDVGWYLACEVNAQSGIYVIETTTATTKTAIKAEPNRSTTVRSVSSVYVCESANDSYYHTYDCEDLSHYRRVGYGIYEMSLASAKKSYRACPKCHPGS